MRGAMHSATPAANIKRSSLVARPPLVRQADHPDYREAQTDSDHNGKRGYRSRELEGPNKDQAECVRALMQ